MISYEECLSKYYLERLKRLVYRDKFSSVAKALEYAISDLIMEHVSFGHIDPDEPHNAQTLIKKQIYPHEKEFVRTAVKELLKREKLWLKKSS